MRRQQHSFCLPEALHRRAISHALVHNPAVTGHQDSTGRPEEGSSDSDLQEGSKIPTWKLPADLVDAYLL